MILIVDMNGQGRQMGFYEFVMPIVSAVGRENCMVRKYSELDWKDFELCEKVIISGVPLKDESYLAESDKFAWIKDFEKPILGICAGMQVIGMVFGASVGRCTEIGMANIKVVKKSDLLSEDIRAYCLHNNAIGLPDEFDVLAESSECVHAIKHKSRDIYGVMFHPEVRNREIIGNFLSL